MKTLGSSDGSRQKPDLKLKLLGVALCSAAACSEQSKSAVEGGQGDDASIASDGSAADGTKEAGVDITRDESNNAIDAEGRWQAGCIATFTRDYDLTDIWGDVEATIKKGTRHVVSEFGPYSSALEPQIILVNARGAVIVELDEVATIDELPFTSNCSPDATQEYRGVFADVTVFADPELTIELCQLKVGDYAVADDPEFGYEGTHVLLGALAKFCNGQTSGYIPEPPNDPEDPLEYAIPLISFRGPSE